MLRLPQGDLLGTKLCISRSFHSPLLSIIYLGIYESILVALLLNPEAEVHA